MADQQQTLESESEPEPEPENEPEEEDSSSESEESDSSDSDTESESESDSDPKLIPRTRAAAAAADDDSEDEDNSPEANINRYMSVLNSKWMKKELSKEEGDDEDPEELFDFPPDPEGWREEDLMELWGDAPVDITKPGWDPNDVDEDELEVIRKEIKEGRDPPIAPFYVPYRKPYPVIPDNHYDISTPKAVIEELDRIEEFLNWVSFIFEDGSTYEGTVWDDMAHGKGVYVAEQGLVRYEGEWLQNQMEGHGVVEVDIPDIEPVPGSKLEEKMRAEGKIIKRDFLSPEDREWLEMDIEDSLRLADGNYEIPFYEKEEWVELYGEKPEKGRYRYAGEWKHSRMHGCGMYELNEQPIFGRFYFGELLEDTTGCEEEIAAMHAAIAEVAAAKSRMFVNKPDGMVREERGPYGDPQHPYFYEEEDVWMAPGFINQFYEVPDDWTMYVHEVDEEREMWLNSFYKAPLRLAMPAELEYWWSQDQNPEFILINKEPEPDPKDPTQLIYTEDPLILHTPTGRIINYIEDEEHGVRLFWQPPLEEGEDVDPKKVQFLPLGFDEFYGRGVPVKEENIWSRIISGVERALNPTFEKLEKWTEEQKKAGEMKMKLIEKEIELVEAELCLEEAIEDEEEELKMIEKEEQKKLEEGLQEEGDIISPERTNEDGKGLVPEQDKEDEEEDEEEDEVVPSSFGSVIDDGKKNNSGKSPFSSASLSLASSSLLSSPNLVSMVPPRLQNMFSSWKGGKLQTRTLPSKPSHPNAPPSCLVTFPQASTPSLKLKVTRQTHHQVKAITKPCFRTLPSRISSVKTCRELVNSKPPSHVWSHASANEELGAILSLHTCLEIGIQ